MFIDDLRAARRGKGLTRAELAQRIGVTEQTIKRLEQGTGSTATLVAAMAALDFHLNGIGRGATLVQQIDARIGKLGWSTAAVARRTGLQRSTVSAVMAGSASMASTLCVLAAVAPNVRVRALHACTGRRTGSASGTAASSSASSPYPWGSSSRS